jgi:hypothetical protein
MARRSKICAWALTIIVCRAFCGDTSIAQERDNKSAPQSGESAAHSDGLSGVRLPTSGPEGTGPGNGPARPALSAAANGRSSKAGTGGNGIVSGRTGLSSGNTAGSVHGIDLVRPAEAYTSGHVGRSSPLSPKKPQIVPSAVVVRPQATLPGATAGPVRNAVGVAMPKSESIHAVSAMPVNTGARNSVGMSLNETRRVETHVTATGAMLPNTGINGTSMGHSVVGTTAIGGPAPGRLGLNGSVMRRRF